MATSRGSVEQGSSDLNYPTGILPEDKSRESPGRGPRPDGTAEVPDRQLDIRGR